MNLNVNCPTFLLPKKEEYENDTKLELPQLLLRDGTDDIL